MTTILIVLSSILTILCGIPYIIDIVKRKTKPRVVSWFTWAILTLIAGFASFSDQQYAAAVLSFSATFEVLLICILGLIYNGDRSISRFDIICQILAIIGFVLWMVFNSPSIAIVFVIVIDVIASLPTIKHAWEKPHEETWITFLGAGIAALFALLAAESFTVTGVANPIYLVIVNFLLFGIITLRLEAANRKFHS